MAKPKVDPIVKYAFVLVFILVPILVYFILKPTPNTNAHSIQRAREFARYIESNHQILNPPSTNGVIKIVQNETPPHALKTQDRLDLYDLAVEWGKADLQRDQRWRDQVETIFSIVERTQNTDALDLLRREIIFGFNSTDEANVSSSKNWLDRYLKIEARFAEREQIKAAYDKSLLQPKESSPSPSL